ncbi:SDR family NAD(P)-dependent oxidoreductase [Falsiroseomonas sp. CW058]|uniref:SDR family NAD(P)-dependent oxidoreductase n=1 Tax=Falsiroseomonas sp. CW058 TaxID=3388664 RepID=UPI003D31A646
MAGQGVRGAVALVAGAGGGIGAAIAEALAAAGAARLLLLARDAAKIRPLLDRLAAGGTAAEVLLHDLAQPGAPALPDRLDLLVHAAGAHGLAPVGETDAALLDAQIAVNLRAPLLLTRAALPALEASRGMVVFVNSSQGLAAGRNAAAYAASKHGLRALADSLRAEVNPRGIRVLSIYPGRTDTPMQRALLAREGREPDPARLLAPADVAAMVLAAASLPPNAEVTDITIRPAMPY